MSIKHSGVYYTAFQLDIYHDPIHANHNIIIYYDYMKKGNRSKLSNMYTEGAHYNSAVVNQLQFQVSNCTLSVLLPPLQPSGLTINTCRPSVSLESTTGLVPIYTCDNAKRML